MTINKLVEEIHQSNLDAGWWKDTEGEDLLNKQYTPYVIATKMNLINSELSEALEAYRKDLNDDHLPHRKGVECELADAVIRIFDLAGALDLDLGGAIQEKRDYNAKRADHKPENRAKKGGKKF